MRTDADGAKERDDIVRLVRRARACLLEPSIARKVELSRETHAWWFSAREHPPARDDDDGDDETLDAIVENPGRETLRVVKSSQTRRIGKGGTLESRIAILHSLAHIESWAIDLSWDAISRFGLARDMPEGFYDDFVTVANDEARHHELLAGRLKALGSAYGDLEVHDGLWQTAMETADSLEARLAVEHCVHEARGLDVLPQTIGKFRRNGDEESAKLLEDVIYPEEVTHCAAGLRWFKYLHARDGVRTGDEEDVRDGEELETSSVVQAFHAVVRKHFAGALKPPFNDDARKRAGFNPVWYEPLAVKA